MGTLLGACLNRADVETELVDVNRAHIDALNRHGATVTGKVHFNVPVRAITPDAMDGVYDVIFLLIKQTYNEVSFRQILPHVDKDSTIVTLQNGLPEPAVAKAFGEDRTMGCAVTWAATMVKPGETIATSDYEFWNSNLGRLDGKITERGREIREILAKMCRTELSSNLAGIRWSKLIINASFSGMSAALGRSFGGVLDDPMSLCCAQHIAKECIEVSRAMHVTLHPIGEEGCLDALMDFTTEAEREKTTWIYRKLFGSCYDGKASMLQDIEKGLRTEIHAINGVVSDYGKQCGVPTPFCDIVVRIVEEIEEGKREANKNNLLLFSGALKACRP